MARRPTYKMLTFARGIIKGMGPLEALEASEYNTEDWGSDQAKASFAQRLLKHPHCADAIATANREIYSDAIMSRKEAIERLTKVARASLSDLMDFRVIPILDSRGKEHHIVHWAVKESDELHPDQLAAISELHALPGGGFKIKLRDPDAAMRQLARLHAWDEHPKAAVGPDGQAVPAAQVSVSIEEFKEARRAMLDSDDI